MAESTGKKQSELIREAVDNLIDRAKGAGRREVIRQTAGMWKDRNDLPVFENLRSEWDRKA